MFYLLILFAIISSPAITIDGCTITLAAADVGGKIVPISGYSEGNARYTNLGNATIKEGGYITLVFNASVEAVRYFRVDADYSYYKVRNIGDDRDVIYDLGEEVLFFHAKIPLHSNGSFIRFKAKSFEVHIGIYKKGKPNYRLLALSVALLLLGLANLFPLKDR